MPLAILEAFAAGLPVVATALGGMPELIDAGVDGSLVPADDPAALGEALHGSRRGSVARVRDGARGAREGRARVRS